MIFLVYRTYSTVHLVEEYKNQVEGIMQETGEKISEESVRMVLAIIYTESAGKGTDVMQARESTTSLAKIKTSDESIKLGMAHLHTMISYAAQHGCDTWTGVQAYNFGPGYVLFVQEKGGKSTPALAEEYSKQLAAKLGNKDAKRYFWPHIQGWFSLKPYIYKDGGNFHYSALVKWNAMLLRIMP